MTHEALDQIDVLDRLNNIEALVDAIFMAAGSVADAAHVNALQRICTKTKDEIEDLYARLETATAGGAR